MGKLSSASSEEASDGGEVGGGELKAKSKAKAKATAKVKA